MISKIFLHHQRRQPHGRLIKHQQFGCANINARWRAFAVSPPESVLGSELRRALLQTRDHGVDLSTSAMICALSLRANAPISRFSCTDNLCEDADPPGTMQCPANQGVRRDASDVHPFR